MPLPQPLDPKALDEFWSFLQADGRIEPEIARGLIRLASDVESLQSALAPQGSTANAPAEAFAALLKRVPGVKKGDNPDAAQALAEFARLHKYKLLSDEELRTELEAESRRKAGVTWGDHFAPELVEGWLKLDAKGFAEVKDAIIARLQWLQLDRINAWAYETSRLALRNVYMGWLIFFLAVPSAVLGGVAVLSSIGSGGVGGWWIFDAGGLASWKIFVTATCMGVIGSLLTTTYKLRDQPLSLREMRAAGSLLGIQSVLGAISAVVICIFIKSGVLPLDRLATSGLDWLDFATVGFVAGFSEAFFLGTVGRVAGAFDDPRSAKPAAKG